MNTKAGVPVLALVGLLGIAVLVGGCLAAGPLAAGLGTQAGPTTAPATPASPEAAPTAQPMAETDPPAGATDVPVLPEATLVPADSDEPSAGICAEATGEWAMVELRPDAPVPRCLKVTGQQRLQATNHTDTVVHLKLGPLTLELQPGATGSLDQVFGTFLALGVHRVMVDGLSGPELWLVVGTLTQTEQQLRITNAGQHDLSDLVVLFPGASADAPARRIIFGDVPAGITTEYRDVPYGVYRYAAYEYTLDGQVIVQPVVDWMGESPLAGTRFTYQLALDPEQPTGGQMRLQDVVTDSP